MHWDIMIAIVVATLVATALATALAHSWTEALYGSKQIRATHAGQEFFDLMDQETLWLAPPTSCVYWGHMSDYERPGLPEREITLDEIWDRR